MKRLGLSMQKVKAIFVSHEHSDHIRGIAVLAKKYNLPVYITPLTLNKGGLYLDAVFEFISQRPIKIGDLEITAFTKLHDAAEPHSFIVSCGEVKVGIFTDIGTVCNNLIDHFKLCHAAFLEANYDEEMLENGRYPYHLKRRIRGGHGHLSNTQALSLFIDHKPAHMSHLLLAHLSKDNNCPKLVYNLFNGYARGAEVIVASRFEETPVYHIAGMGALQTQVVPENAQFSLF
jgi:phosphoribosyl 1,2-cyclic phosphodiesterase